MMLQTPRVLFVTMPWATSIHPSIGLGLLSSILRGAGIASTTLYGNLLMPRPTSSSVYTIEDPGYYEDRSAGLAFVPYLYPHVKSEQIASAVADRYMQIVTREGQLEFDRRTWDWRQHGDLRARLMRQTLEDIRRAGTCLEYCQERIENLSFDIAGFSLTFETQLIASLAMARLIKRRWPERHVMFGGAACTSGQGISMLHSFDFLDVVALGEADATIVDLVRGLREGADLKPIPGIAYRTGSEIVVSARSEPLSQLDQLPVPDYDSYFEQKQNSDWKDTVSVLLFETSRGCWWGQKHLCTFCGLNGEALTYRSKSAPKVLEEIRYFRNRWPVNHGLQAVDNIFPLKYFRDLVPTLVEEQKQHPVGIFFEIKSNLKRNQLFQLAAAGFTTLQPGIESFSDHILRLMDKGATAFQQICCIKWGQEVGISITYNILLRNPGEIVEDYEEMLELMPFITHLLPPNGVANMQLERYSPYFMNPEKYGIRNVRPKSHYAQMFPDENVDLDALVYQFDFDHDELDEPALVSARRALIEAIQVWRDSYRPNQLIYFVGDHEVAIFDRRGGEENIHKLQGAQKNIFLFLERPRTFDNVVGKFADLSPTLLRLFLEKLVRNKLVYHQHRSGTDKYLATAVHAYASRAEYVEQMELAIEEAPGLHKPEARQFPMQARNSKLTGAVRS